MMMEHTDGGVVETKLEPSEVSSPSVSSHDDGSQFSGDDSDEYKEVVWDAETEIALFESIARYPPTGVNRFFSILNSSIYMQKRLNKRITPQQTLEHLNGLYNLEALDDPDETAPITDFTLPSEYTALIEEREKEEEASNPPNNKRKRVEKENEKEKEKEKDTKEKEKSKGKDKDKDKDKEKEKEKEKSKDSESEEDEEEDKKVASPSPASPSSTSPSSGKYATFSEFLQSALAALGGSADLHTLYDYAAEHSHEVDKKYASRFEGGTGKAATGYKSNVRSTLHNNACFTKLPNGNWTMNTNPNPSKKK